MLNINVPKDTKIIVCGDIHEHENQFNELLNQVQPNEKTWLVSVGDIYDKGDGIACAERITSKLIELQKSGCCHAIQGNHELKHIRKTKRSNESLTPHLRWWDKQPKSLSFRFHNQFRVTIVHGGVLPKHTWHDLAESVDTCYVRKVDENGKAIPLIKKMVEGVPMMVPKKTGGKVWHELYDGRFGYIASGHDSQKDGIPKFYNYSCNLDTAVYNTGKLTAQEFVDGTRGEMITIDGNAKYPNGIFI